MQKYISIAQMDNDIKRRCIEVETASKNWNKVTNNVVLRSCAGWEKRKKLYFYIKFDKTVFLIPGSHRKLPRRLVHNRFGPQPPLFVEHSLISGKLIESSLIFSAFFLFYHGQYSCYFTFMLQLNFLDCFTKILWCSCPRYHLN